MCKFVGNKKKSTKHSKANACDIEEFQKYKHDDIKNIENKRRQLNEINIPY